MSFDVVLKGPQFEGTAPVNNFVDFVLNINRPASVSYSEILPNSTGFGAVEIYRDHSVNAGQEIVVDANPAFTVTLVPEPATASVAMLGLLTLTPRRRRNRPVSARL